MAFRRRFVSPYAKYLTACSRCGGRTSKPFARANGGKCKACTTGTAPVAATSGETESEAWARRAEEGWGPGGY